MDDADLAAEILERSMSRYTPPREVHVNATQVCRDCGELIGRERLRVYPGAARCLGCQVEMELGNNRAI